MTGALQLSVGELVHRCRGGDINFGFSGHSSATDGLRGHQAVQRSRGDDYVAEARVSASVCLDGHCYEVQGRADGYELTANGLVVDEIKTLRIPPSEVPQDVLQMFWHQAKLYAAMLAHECATECAQNITVRLCLYDLETRKEEQLVETASRTDLAQLFIDTLLRIHEQESARRAWFAVRDESIGELHFPHREYRAGQRDMAVSVYRSIAEGTQLAMQAPTGIGKTMGALFPAVQSLRTGDASKIFYLSARTTQQALAEEAAVALRYAKARLRSVTITAKEKACLNPGEPCHPDHCEYARGYYDRLPGAMTATLAQEEHLTRDVIAREAKRHTVCPFEFSLDLAREADLVIADYNYAFDPTVRLRRFFDQDGGQQVLLIDEAHNLIDRARDMFSAIICKETYLDCARLFAEFLPHVAKSAKSVSRAIARSTSERSDAFKRDGHLVFEEPPEAILTALEKFCDVVEAELKQRADLPHKDALLDAYFAALRFTRTHQDEDEDYVTILQRQRDKRHELHLYCLNPAARLADGFGRARASICFSATLSPKRYYAAQLGLDESAQWYRLPPVFPPEHLAVVRMTGVNTRYRHRAQSAPVVAQTIEAVVGARQGNYLVFFPSYQYLELVYDIFETGHQGRLLRQTPGMDDQTRTEFIETFQTSDAPVCGFAVMGGIFAEGIDLKGDALMGVVVVGVGLPQLCVERDLIREHFNQAHHEHQRFSDGPQGEGFQYAYQYPGITRVLQTAGRVIRDQADRGVVCLVDDRYRESSYEQLLPDEWRIQDAKSPQAARELLRQFWREQDQA